MGATFNRKLPIPKDLKEEYPLDEQTKKIKAERDLETKRIMTGESDRLLLVIGPCSADNEDALMDYVTRLAKIQEEVKEKIHIIPRVFTNKPRTKGTGYKGLLHQPDPEKPEDMLAGIIAIRQLHTRVLKETGFTTADEMLYSENYRYLSDLLGYVTVGARSVEDQQHRLVASGIDIPVGMKNPTSGDISVMMNGIYAAQSKQTFIYRGWEVVTDGNPMAHAVLRGYVDSFGHSHPNYHYEDLQNLMHAYQNMDLANPAVIVDTNHSNSGKKYQHQSRIAKDILHSREHDRDIKKLVKGLLVESYLVDGAQDIGGGTYGQSITDPCLGWTGTEKLIRDLADSL